MKKFYILDVHSGMRLINSTRGNDTKLCILPLFLILFIIFVLKYISHEKIID